MRHFAFIIHSVDLGWVSIAFKEPNLLKKKNSLLKKAFEWLPSFECAEVAGVKSPKNLTLKGNLIYCGLFPEQIMSLKKEVVLDRIISGGKIAEELGADILGLGAYAAQVGRKGVDIAKAINIPVTTGTHYTISIAIESTLSAAKKAGIDIKKSNLVIIGATGGIGKACAEILAGKVDTLTLVARSGIRLNGVKENLKTRFKTKIIIEDDIKTAIKKSDIAIMSTTTPTALIDINELKPGALVCDISRPRNVSQNGKKLRKDVLVIDGGIVKPPGQPDFNFFIGLPKGLAYACIAETMILAFEEKYESYSLGGKISADKVSEITRLGKKHGFELAEIRSFDLEVPDEVFENMRKLNVKRK